MSDTSLRLINEWARKKGLVLFIDSDATLSCYPKKNPACRLLEKMLYKHHPEMKMFLIRTMQEGEE